MERNNGVDYSLYLVTDRGAAKGRGLPEIVEAAIEGGVTIVQFREKQGPDEEIIDEAKEIQRIAKSKGVHFIMNDRVDLAVEIGADGVHVGQSDAPAGVVRRKIGERMILGVSVRTVEEARQAEADGADNLGINNVFGTRTKQDAEGPLGLGMVTAISRSVRIPIVGIGGIRVNNARSVIEAGADGIAVISAIIAQPSPEAAARRLYNVISK